MAVRVGTSVPMFQDPIPGSAPRRMGIAPLAGGMGVPPTAQSVQPEEMLPPPPAFLQPGPTMAETAVNPTMIGQQVGQQTAVQQTQQPPIQPNVAAPPGAGNGPPAPPQPPPTGAPPPAPSGPGTFHGPANNPHDYNTIWEASNHDPQTFVHNLIVTNGINQAHQSQPGSLNPILQGLRAVGYTNATLDQRSDGLSKGIYLDGTPGSFVKLLDGNDNYIWQPGGEEGSAASNPNINPNDPALDEALKRLLSGQQGPIGGQTSAALLKLIASGGARPNIDQDLISARESAANAENAQLNDAAAMLADRGGLSVQGIEQGGTPSAIQQIQQNIAPSYAESVRTAEQHATDTENANYMSALQMLTGMSAQESQTMLGALGTGTQRQTAMANIALQALNSDRSWQQFLMQHQLDQQQLQHLIDQGNWQVVLQLLQLYLQGANVSSGGHE